MGSKQTRGLGALSEGIQQLFLSFLSGDWSRVRNHRSGLSNPGRLGALSDGIRFRQGFGIALMGGAVASVVSFQNCCFLLVFYHTFATYGLYALLISACSFTLLLFPIRDGYSASEFMMLARMYRQYVGNHKTAFGIVYVSWFYMIDYLFDRVFLSGLFPRFVKFFINICGCWFPGDVVVLFFVCSRRSCYMVDEHCVFDPVQQNVDVIRSPWWLCTGPVIV